MPDLIQIPKPELGRPNDSRLTQAYLDARPELKGLTPFNPSVDFDLVDMINDRLGQLHALVQYADADLYGAVTAARDSAVQAAQDAQDNIAAVNAEWADTKGDIDQAQAELGLTAVPDEAALPGKPAGGYRVLATNERVYWSGVAITARAPLAATQTELAAARDAIGNLATITLSTRAQSAGPQLADGSRWTWAASGTPNGGTVVAAQGGGVWTREYAGGAIRASWFPGTQAGAQAFLSAGAGRLAALLDRDFTLTASLTLPSNLNLVGAGGRFSSAAQIQFMVGVDTARTTLTEIDMQGNRPAVADNVAPARGVVELTRPRQVKLVGCHIWDHNAYGVRVSDPEGFSLSGCRIHDLGVQTVSNANNTDGVLLTGTTAVFDVMIAENTIYNIEWGRASQTAKVADGDGIQINALPSLMLKNVTIRNNRIYDTGRRSIKIMNSGVQAYGNDCSLTNTGILLGVDQDMYDILMESNLIYDVNEGIALQNVAGDFKLYGVRIRGNTIRRVRQGNSLHGYGILTSRYKLSAGSEIVGNVVDDTDACALQLNADYCTVSDNTFINWGRATAAAQTNSAYRSGVFAGTGLAQGVRFERNIVTSIHADATSALSVFGGNPGWRMHDNTFGTPFAAPVSFVTPSDLVEASGNRRASDNAASYNFTARGTWSGATAAGGFVIITHSGQGVSGAPVTGAMAQYVGSTANRARVTTVSSTTITIIVEDSTGTPIPNSAGHTVAWSVSR